MWPARWPSSSSNTEQEEKYKQQQAQITVTPQTKAVALLFVSVSNKSKQKPAGLSRRMLRRQCPEYVSGCAFLFMMCVMPQNCLIKSLCEICGHFLAARSSACW